jgi:hypothetical protein
MFCHAKFKAGMKYSIRTSQLNFARLPIFTRMENVHQICIIELFYA